MGRKTSISDNPGSRYGRWVVLRRDGSIGPSAAFLCRCDCGVERRVRAQLLANGSSQSCGCAAREKLGNRVRKHGGWRHPLYRTWTAMHDRCRRAAHHAYDGYGGRGIVVCERWSDFAAFRDDMYPSWTPGLTLDRIDNDAGYSAQNCRWATPLQQSMNRRNTRYLKHDGERLSVSDWAKRMNVSPNFLWNRITKGWDDSDVVSRPKRRW